MRGVKRTKLTTYYKGKKLGVESTTFSVPTEFLELCLKNVFETTLPEFLDDYTWDDSEFIYFEAKRNNVLAY